MDPFREAKKQTLRKLKILREVALESSRNNKDPNAIRIYLCPGGGTRYTPWSQKPLDKSP